MFPFGWDSFFPLDHVDILFVWDIWFPWPTDPLNLTKVGTLYVPHCYKNRKKKWARSEKKDKNKCPFFKWWDLLFEKTHIFFTCEANAANYDFLGEDIGCMKIFIINLWDL